MGTLIFAEADLEADVWRRDFEFKDLEIFGYPCSCNMGVTQSRFGVLMKREKS